MTRFLTYLRHNVIALVALFVALGGTSYAALRLPAGSVGTRQLKNRAVTAAKLNPASVAASVRAWAVLSWDGSRWHLVTSSRDAHASGPGSSQVSIRWEHTRFPSDCMASVTPLLNRDGKGVPGYATPVFQPSGHTTTLIVFGVGQGGAGQPQSVNVLIVCPTPGGKRFVR